MEKDAVKSAERMANLPFSTGKRKCTGHNMGKVIIKAYIVQLLSRYEFEWPGNKGRFEERREPTMSMSGMLESVQLLIKQL
jgi:cytochrome P450